MNDTAEPSPPKLSLGAKAAAFLVLPAATALVTLVLAHGQQVAILFPLAVYLGFFAASLLLALVLKFAARGVWARQRRFFFVMWLSAIPVAILIGLVFNAIAHWGGPPD